MIASSRRKGVPAGPGFVVALVVMASIPDLDLVIGFFAGNVNLYHHLWTHSVVFAALAGVLFGTAVQIFARRGGAWAGFLGCLAVLSHILIDWLAADHAAPYGVQALWPFSRNFYLFPAPLFPEVVRNPESRSFVASLFNRANARAVAIELLYLGIPAAFLARRLKNGFRETS